VTETAGATEPTSEPTETKQPEAKKTTTPKPKPKPVEAVRVSKRQWSKIKAVRQVRGHVPAPSKSAPRRQHRWH
jgi:hypothetical protein